MSESSFDSESLQRCIDRWQTGDRAAADELIRATGARLEKLARKMTRGFPNVRAFAETGDVLQSSLIRLLRTLQTLRPTTMRDFYNLAAVHIRRELLDLARRYKGKGCARLEAPTDSGNPGGPTLAANTPGDDFDFWVRFHEAIEHLPVEEREVVGLVFYHGWTQAKIGELFGVDERTVRRRWTNACERLRLLIGVNPFER